MTAAFFIMAMAIYFNVHGGTKAESIAASVLFAISVVIAMIAGIDTVLSI